MRTFHNSSALQMAKMRIGTALAFLGVVMSPLLLECTPCTCEFKVGNPNVCTDYVTGCCPVKLTSVPLQEPTTYSECVTVHVWMTADDPKIEMLSPVQELIKPIKKRKKKERRNRRQNQVKCEKGVTQLLTHNKTSFPLGQQVHCVEAEALQVVSVSYSTASMSCNVSYMVPDPKPDFDLSVNQSSKSISISVQPGNKVYARLCYQSDVLCSEESDLPRITLDPSQSQSADLNMTYLLPCVCVEVYYTHRDALRHKKCPFQNERVADVRDVWLSSEVVPYKHSLEWKPKCPPRDLPVKISLCWRQHEHLCTPVLNSTLEENDDGQNLIINTSAVDKHPQMCVQFSLQGIHNISCPFQGDMSSWEVYIGLGRQSVFVYLNSLVPAMFSAQFCVLNKTGCTPIGSVHTVRMKRNTTEIRMNVPPHFLAEKPCVQVWQSDPVLLGRRILCPDYTHNRCGIYAVAAVVFVVIVMLLGVCIHRLTKSGAAGWLYIQNPVLLVCSSEQSAHVSAVCALASILQGELSATVHMALWAQSSQRQNGVGTGVADLGPLPWLYGQWEVVRKAQGKVLIIWSPEAKKTYEKWRKERATVDKGERKKEDNSKAEMRDEKIKVDVEVDYKLNGRGLGKCKKEKANGKKDCDKLCDDKDWYPQKSHSTVTAPVFEAALACLEGALQQSKGQGVAIIYFQGLGHSRDIPKVLRGIPRYCLPQDFRGLIQELGGLRRQTNTGKFKFYCWPRLMSKVLSIWLARKLAHRLQTLLPQTQGKKTQGLSITSSQKMMSHKTQSRLKLPLAANMARTGPTLEQEPLHESPQRAEKP